MEIIEIDLLKNKNYLGELILCLGFFDGLHQGHLSLIERAIEISKNSNLVPALLTFDVNPLIVLNVIKQEKILTTVNDRAKILEELGIKKLIVLKFEQIYALPPEQFILDILIPIGVKHLVCGFDYRYGTKGAGTPENIGSISKGAIKVDIIPEKVYQKDKISSTKIHKLLDEGNIELVNLFLTRKFKVSGKVVKGNGKGSKYGFPTANIELDASYHLPKNGVYAVEVIFNNKLYAAMANIGYHPTMGKLNNIQIEVNIFDFSQNIYNQNLDVYFVKFIREEKEFKTISDLYNQIEIDKKSIKNILQFKD